MKTTSTFSALIVSFLALLSSCSTPQHDLVPATTAQDPLASTTTPGTTKQRQVVQITDYFVGPTGEKSVTLAGKDLKISWRLRNEYAYDTQNRLVQQKTAVWNNANWWEEFSYQYTPDLIQRYRNVDNKDFLNTLLLNDKGYLKGNLGSDEYVYDADGYLISYNGNGQRDTYTQKDGNVAAKETVFSSGDVQKNTYEYDLTKLGIPSPLTFRGRQSRNLLIRQTLVTTSPKTADSQTTVFTYQYDFDQQGRAIREFVVSDAAINWPASIREFVYQ